MLFSGEGSKKRGRRHCLDAGVFFILAKSPTALSLNSKDLCNCVAQGAAQHWSLTRADAAARGTWFALNGSWLGSGTHVVRY